MFCHLLSAQKVLLFNEADFIIFDHPSDFKALTLHLPYNNQKRTCNIFSDTAYIIMEFAYANFEEGQWSKNT